MNIKRYSMIIEWSDEDQAYIVTVPELPGCRTRQGQDAIESWIMVAEELGRPVPAPKLFAA